MSSVVQLAPQIDPLTLSIERTQRAIYVISAINIFFVLIFAEYTCLFRDICHISLNIDIPPYASHAFLPLLLITLILTILAYESAEFIHINYLGPLRIIILVYCILMIGYTIAEFVAAMVLSDTDRSSTWGQLTPLAQSYYNNSLSDLNTAYRVNMIIVCVFQLVNAVLLLGCGIAVWVLYSKTPTGYLPRSKYHVVAQHAVEEKPLVHDPYSHQLGNRPSDQDFRPDSRQDFRLDPRQDLRTESRPEFRTGAQQDFRQDSRPEFREGYRTDFREDPRPEYRDDSRQDLRPEYRAPEQRMEFIREDDSEHPLAPGFNPLLRRPN